MRTRARKAPDGSPPLTNTTCKISMFPPTASTAVFKSWDKLYTLDLTNTQAEPSVVNMTAGEDESDNFELKSINKSVTEAAISPDGKVMAYIAYGEVYIRNIGRK